jgi:hypothetical protein
MPALGCETTAPHKKRKIWSDAGGKFGREMEMPRAPAISLGARGARNSVYKRLKLLFLLSPRIISNKMSAPSRCNILLRCQFFSLHRGAQHAPSAAEDFIFAAAAWKK